MPSVSLTRSRDGSTGTATFKFERPSVLSLHDVWDNGLVTGLWLQDEEGSLHSPDLSVDFAEGRPSELTAILVLTRSLSTMAGYNTREKLPLPRGDNARGCFWVVESLKVTNEQ